MSNSTPPTSPPTSPPTPQPKIVLHQFLYSHFNEKARWALTYKGVPHQRVTYLPGPHMPKIKKLSGQRQTPVMTWDGDVVAGSANIVDRLEAQIEDHPLLPKDDAARREVLDLQTEMDARLGPATRTAFFSVLINEGGYLSAMFARDSGVIGRGLYRAMFPIARPLIAKANGTVDPKNVERAFQITNEYLDRVVDQTRATGYLCGNGFTLADLTAASLLAPLANVDHPDMKRPQPMPDSIRQFYDLWRDHPGIDWVRRMYAQHR